MTVEQMKEGGVHGRQDRNRRDGAADGPEGAAAVHAPLATGAYKESADHIKAVGAENFVLGTDLGQTGNPSQPDGLAMLVVGLMAEGITKDQIRLMGREVPGKLLMG